MAHCGAVDVRRNRLLGSRQRASIRRDRVGVRAQAERIVPRGFPKSNKFGPAF